MNRLFLFLIACIGAGCHYGNKQDPLTLIQIQDRNGLTETISNPDRLQSYETMNFLSSQPYKKVLRVYKTEGKNRSQITTYHPNGMIYQYLEAEELRAHGNYREWFPNGRMKIESTVIAGTADLVPGVQGDWVFDSLSRVWDEQGNLIASIPYEKGMLEGKSIYYYPSGQIERELPFVKNNLEGEGVEFWPEGTLKGKTQYKKGIKEGESRGFFENGQLAWIEDYLDGRLRKGVYYDPERRVISEIENGGGFQALFEEKRMKLIEFRVGIPEGKVQHFNSSGELERSYFVKNGKRQGEEIEYFLSSETEGNFQSPLPKLSVHWNENIVHGSVKTWYNNGQLQSQREYVRNQKTGPCLGWYRDGSLMLYEEYEEDRILSGQYYKIQKKEAVSSIHQGNGIATLFDEEGIFLRKINYSKGKPADSEE